MSELLLTILAVAVIAISIWAIQYFAARIFYNRFRRWDDQQNQHEIKHSPTEQDLRS
jgi:hypothetical protein